MDNSQEFEQIIRADYDKVWKATKGAIGSAQWKIKNENAAMGRLTVSTGMSLMSFGETLSIVLEEEGEAKTRLKMTSTAKVGANIASRGRHAKHFDMLLDHIGAKLGTFRK